MVMDKMVEVLLGSSCVSHMLHLYISIFPFFLKFVLVKLYLCCKFLYIIIVIAHGLKTGKTIENTEKH